MKYKNYFIITAVLFILSLFQTSFFAGLFGLSLNPNLILVLVFGFLFVDKTSNALFSAFVGGLLLDILGSSLLGVSSLLIVSFVLLTSVAKKYVQESKYFQGMLLVCFHLIYLGVINFGHFRMSAVLFLGAFITLILAFLSSLIIRNLGNESRYL